MAQTYDSLRDIAQRELANQIPFENSALKAELQRLSTWLDQAANINANDGLNTSDFVRTATEAIVDSTDNPITPADFQRASDGLVREVISEVINKQRSYAGNWERE